MSKNDYMTPPELAVDLNVKVQTLAQWRYYGRGPFFVKVEGEVRYPLESIKKYKDELVEKTHIKMEANKQRQRVKSNGFANA